MKVLTRFLLRRGVPCATFATKPITSSSLFVVSHPGARILELSRPEKGNELSEDLIKAVSRKFKLFESNHTVAAIMVTSKDLYKFSTGLQQIVNDKAATKQLVATANKWAIDFGKSTKETISVYSGLTEGSAYGLFAGAKYRLGTEATKFQLTELLNGSLPIGGGLAYHLANGSKTGVSMARYLAVSGRVLSVNDMRDIGLLTHIVEMEPHISLLDALAHSFPENDNSKIAQNEVVDALGVKDLLDTMDIKDPEDMELNVANDEIWNEVLLVPPQPLNMDSLFEGREDQKQDIEDIAADIDACFSSDDIDQVKKLLESRPEPWAKVCLKNLHTINPDSLKLWFHLTRLASKESLVNICQAEENIVSKIPATIINK